MADTALADDITAFRNYLQAERGMAGNTVLAYGRDLAYDRIVRYRALFHQAATGEREGDVGPSDRSAARAAISLYHIAIEIDLTLA